MSEIHTFHYLCIGCPLGCRLEVDAESDGSPDRGPDGSSVVEVRGFACRRGREYAIQEHTAPRRIVTTTVAITGARWPRLPVRSSAPAPKDKVQAICNMLRRLRVSAPVAMGDIIVSNILDSGVDIVASRDMAALLPGEI
jgi:CxxC motif-containing protein